jgi:hypothetical protein
LLTGVATKLIRAVNLEVVKRIKWPAKQMRVAAAFELAGSLSSENNPTIF